MSKNSVCQLSADEAALIERYIDFYRTLDSGQRPPTSAAQSHFVAVCRCQAKASTPHEITYIKHRMLLAGQHDAARDDAGMLDDFGEGVPKPGWFSDAGWKRMRGQYLSNSN